MSKLSLRCVRAAFVFLMFGIALGSSFALDRSLGAQFRPLHAELNLWGWLTLLIYGFAYHMLPRFLGRALRLQQLADVQSWLAIVGTALSSFAWLGLVYDWPAARGLAVVASLGQASAALMFVWLIGSLLLPRPVRVTSDTKFG